MAEDRPGGEPTEEPTPKRLRDARRKGEIARSRDATAGAAFIAALAFASHYYTARFAATGDWLRGANRRGISRNVTATVTVPFCRCRMNGSFLKQIS